MGFNYSLLPYLERRLTWNCRWSYGMNEELQPVFYVGIITYPYPNSGVSSFHLCYTNGGVLSLIRGYTCFHFTLHIDDFEWHLLDPVTLFEIADWISSKYDIRCTAYNTEGCTGIADQDTEKLHWSSTSKYQTTMWPAVITAWIVG